MGMTRHNLQSYPTIFLSSFSFFHFGSFMNSPFSPRGSGPGFSGSSLTGYPSAFYSARGEQGHARDSDGYSSAIRKRSDSGPVLSNPTFGNGAE